MAKAKAKDIVWSDVKETEGNPQTGKGKLKDMGKLAIFFIDEAIIIIILAYFAYRVLT